MQFLPGAAKAMELAMEEAGVKPEEVDYINAHGTGTHHNDLFETRAVRRAFGESADHLKMSSTKSMRPCRGGRAFSLWCARRGLRSSWRGCRGGSLFLLRSVPSFLHTAAG